MKRAQLLGLWAVLFALLVLGRFALSPVTDFSADDWPYLAKSGGPSPAEIVKDGVRDIYRPANLIANMLFFHWAGDRPAPFALWGLAAHGLLLALLLLLLKRLQGDSAMLWAAGLFYVLNPNIHESFHWACHEVLLYVPIVLAASLLLWIGWCQGGGGWKYALALPLYFIAVFSYEYGVPMALFFPLSALALGAPRKKAWASIPFAAIAVFYVLWRFTGAFGWGTALLAGGEYFGDGGVSLAGTAQNLRGVFSWWIGGRMAQSFLGGFNVFATLLPKWQFAFSAVAAALALSAFLQMRRAGKEIPEAPDDSRLRRTILLGLAWAALAYAPHLVFPSSARHNLFPSIGLAMAFAAAVRLFRWRVPAVGFVLAALLCLVANAGNTLAFREAGEFSRNLYRQVVATRAEWKGGEAVVFDTASLRARQTRGLLKPVSRNPDTWAAYQNANLLRGFTCSAMLKLAAGETRVQAVLDVECGAWRDGDRLVWHERYDESKPRETPMEKVFWIDCLPAGQTTE